MGARSSGVRHGLVPAVGHATAKRKLATKTTAQRQRRLRAEGRGGVDAIKMTSSTMTIAISLFFVVVLVDR